MTCSQFHKAIITLIAIQALGVFAVLFEAIVILPISHRDTKELLIENNATLKNLKSVGEVAARDITEQVLINRQRVAENSESIDKLNDSVKRFSSRVEQLEYKVENYKNVVK